MRKIFIDTNILLDVVLHRCGFFEQAAAIWADCESRQVQGFVSAISLNNMHYIMRKRVEAAAALEYVRFVLNIFSVVPLDEAIFAPCRRSSAQGFRRCHSNLFCGSGQGRLYCHSRPGAFLEQLYASDLSRGILGPFPIRSRSRVNLDTIGELLRRAAADHAPCCRRPSKPNRSCGENRRGSGRNLQTAGTGCWICRTGHGHLTSNVRIPTSV